MAEQKRQCSKKVSDSTGRYSHPCRQPYKVTRDGKDYCATHDPEYVKAKKAKEQAEWDAKRATDKARWAWDAARDKAVAGLTLEELQQVTPGLIRRVLHPTEEDPKGYHWNVYGK